MLPVTASTTARRCLALVSYAIMATVGCAASPSAPRPREQRSDLALAPRQQQSTRGWIGILVTAGEGDQGVHVLSVVPDSPAALAGITTGDELESFDERPIEGAGDFVAAIRACRPGTVLRIDGQRGATRRMFEVTVESMPDGNSVLERMFVGRSAPSLDGLVPIGSGAAPQWNQLRGNVVVLDFWAPWCGVCHIVANELNQWQAEFGDRVHVIGISAAPVEDVTRFAPRFHMRYTIAADPQEKVSKAFDASAVPLVLVVDATGVVRAITLGYSSARMAAMKQLVAQLVSQQ